MQSISFCFINFENVPSKRYTMYSLLNVISARAIDGRINRNGIVTFGKICHLPRGGMALICTVIKGLQVLGREGLNTHFETQLPAKLLQ